MITNFHTEAMLKHKLVDFIIEFMEEVDKEISEMKLFVSPASILPCSTTILTLLQLNSRARFIAESFLDPVRILPLPLPAVCCLLTIASSSNNCAFNSSSSFSTLRRCNRCFISHVLYHPTACLPPAFTLLQFHRASSGHIPFHGDPICIYHFLQA